MLRINASAREAFSLLLGRARRDGGDRRCRRHRHGERARAAQLFGFDRTEMVGHSIETLVPERYRGAHFGHRAAFFQAPAARPMGAGLELFGLRKDGSEFTVEISLSPVQTDHGVVAISAIRDITDRKRAEAKFRGLRESAPDAILIVDRRGRIVLVNAQTERLFGYPREALLGQRVEMLIPARFLPGHEHHREAYFSQPAFRPMGAGLELYGRRADATEFPVEISLSTLETEDGLLVASAIRDITDRKRADEERVKLAREQAARAEAEQANRLKDEFLAMLAHELRNPLAAINTGLGVLERIGTQDDAAVGTREVMSRQLRQLSRMVDDLLDVSRVSTGKITLHRQLVDVADLIARCVAGITSTGRADQHEITVRTRPGARPCRSYETGADRHEPPHERHQIHASRGTITITAGGANGAAVIAVEDTGIGMAPELIERVFDLFVQGQRSPARSEGGLGIGLTLVKRLVEMHGGTIQAASAGPGRGSRFTVRLPAAVIPPKAESRARPTVTAMPSGHRVLVVEDNDDVRKMLRLLLELYGHEVHEAADGYAGLHAALDLSPDIAFVDIGLPGVDGYELVRQLRAKRGSERTMLVAVTGYGRAEDREKIRQAGFQAHLIKPVDPDAVRGVIAAAPRLR